MAALVPAGAAKACDVPVFQYALEHWRAESYELTVCYRDGLDDQAKRLVGDLRQAGDRANLLVRTVDLSTGGGSMQPADEQCLPWMELRYPIRGEHRRLGWAGPFDQASVEGLVDSPARRRIVEYLLARKSGVWVLLSSGDSRRDRAARRLLKDELARLERTLELPVNAPADERISFAIVNVSRHDPAERMFVRLLLGSEADLGGRSDPIVFPVCGRGLILYALVGEGINEWTIAEAAEFLVGPCSCQVKSQNPGMDMLMAVDWDGRVQVTVADAFSLGSLSGFTDRAELARQMLSEPAPAGQEAQATSSRLGGGGMAAIFGLTGVGAAIAVWLVICAVRKESSGS